MPFEPGNKTAEGHGRKGYEFEASQLKTMRNMFSKYLVIMERIFKDEYKEEKKYRKKRDILNMSILGPDIRKIMDKLHASKSESDDSLRVILPKPLLGGESNDSDNNSDKETSEAQEED